MPIVNLGKRRESLIGSGELYKKRVIEYLETTGYYPKMDSFIEGTLADCILSRKGEVREYWLETKATTISLYDAEFASELGRYLAAYLTRSRQTRFKMKLAIQNYRKPEIFEAIYDRIDSHAIGELIGFISKSTDKESREVISKADFADIKQFFDETEVIRADLEGLQRSIEQRHPKPPLKPKLADAEYAAKVLDRYRTNQPLEEKDTLLSNLFALKLPANIFIASTPFGSYRDVREKHPEVLLPILRFAGKEAYTFHPFSVESYLGNILAVESVESCRIEEWDTTQDTTNIILYLTYRWIAGFCRKKGLSYDDRTDSYFFSEATPRRTPKTINWKHPRTNRLCRRKVIKPVLQGESIYYYEHRAVTIRVRKLWGEYFIQLIPRWIFSGDCFRPFPGDVSDRLDRAYRKSDYTRNRNQLNDVLFWSWYLFAGGAAAIESYLRPNDTPTHRPVFHVGSQLQVMSNRRPNIADREEVGDEEAEEIETGQILDSFLAEED